MGQRFLLVTILSLRISRLVCWSRVGSLKPPECQVIVRAALLDDVLVSMSDALATQAKGAIQFWAPETEGDNGPPNRIVLTNNKRSFSYDAVGHTAHLYSTSPEKEMVIAFGKKARHFVAFAWDETTKMFVVGWRLGTLGGLLSEFLELHFWRVEGPDHGMPKQILYKTEPCLSDASTLEDISRG